MEPIYYSINEDAAKTAKGMYSFTPYLHGSETADYKMKVDSAYELANKAIESVPEQEERVRYLVDSYAKKLAEWTNQGFAIECRCPSVLICGPSNFPTERKEKQNAARATHMKKYEKIEGLLDKLCGIEKGSSIIKSADKDAIEKLRAKIKKLEHLQEHMKAANAYYRKNTSPTSRPPHFPPYVLSNNRQNIAACKKRLASLEAAKSSEGAKQIVVIDGEEVELVENTEEMRIQFLFPDKPDEEVRAILKRNAFRWSGKNKAWQRQLTDNGRWAARRVVEELAK